MKRKKYLFIVPSLSKGGAERVVSVLASELTKKERDAVIVTHFWADEEYPVCDNVKIVCLSELNEKDYKKKISIIYLIKLARMLRKAIIQQEPDYILPFFMDNMYQNGLGIVGIEVKRKSYSDS